MNTKLHAVTDAEGRPLSFFMTAGQVSDYTGAAALLDDLPKAQWMLGDRGYDADWYRDALQAKGITGSGHRTGTDIRSHDCHLRRWPSLLLR
jgi:transposase